jgi:hypothetical protein
MAHDMFPGYEPKKKNRLVMILSDKCFAGTSTPTDPEPSTSKANIIVEDIIKQAERNLFEIEAFGPVSSMTARLNKRNEERLYTETEVLNFVNAQISLLLFTKETHKITPEELQKFVSNEE